MVLLEKLAERFSVQDAFGSETSSKFQMALINEYINVAFYRLNIIILQILTFENPTYPTSSFRQRHYVN